MKDKEIEAVYQMAMHQGWDYLKEFINNNIKNCNNRLSGHGEEIESLEELKSLQAKKKAYESILNFVDRRIEEMENN